MAANSVSDWFATPAPFDTEKHGVRAIFSGDNSVVERRRPDDDPRGCLCYTSQQLQLGKVWQTTVLNTTSSWRGGLVSSPFLLLDTFTVMQCV